MTQPSAKTIADSVFEGSRLITLEIELHRFILPEYNTHRSLSRNFQSSRAVPVKQMIEQVRNNPAMPVHWGLNEPGMVANGEIEDNEHVVHYWKEAAKEAADSAFYMDKQGLHKQIVNRLLEPFMWTKGVSTGTLEAWQAFLKLRLHKDAQPEIKALAEQINEAINTSSVVELGPEDWHMPYFGDGYWLKGCGISLQDALMISTSCTGQVSYRKLDDTLEKAKKIYGMLNLPEGGVYKEDPPHFSPTEHQAKARNSGVELSGNFQTKDSWMQYRKLLEKGYESIYIGEIK
jgi:hypothetical protein